MASGLSVFHESDTSDKTTAQLENIVKKGISPRYGQENKLSPEGAVQTSFYAVRSFLWAVFCSEICTRSLRGYQRNALSTLMNLNGQEYRGILLFSSTALRRHSRDSNGIHHRGHNQSMGNGMPEGTQGIDNCKTLGP